MLDFYTTYELVTESDKESAPKIMQIVCTPIWLGEGVFFTLPVDDLKSWQVYGIVREDGDRLVLDNPEYGETYTFTPLTRKRLLALKSRDRAFLSDIAPSIKNDVDVQTWYREDWVDHLLDDVMGMDKAAFTSHILEDHQNRKKTGDVPDLDYDKTANVEEAAEVIRKALEE